MDVPINNHVNSFERTFCFEHSAGSYSQRWAQRLAIAPLLFLLAAKSGGTPALLASSAKRQRRCFKAINSAGHRKFTLYSATANSVK